MNSPSRVAAWLALQFRQRALQTALETLSRGGVPALPVKGILLVHQIYRDPVERPLADVDLLIRPKDFGKALRIARDARWPLVWDSKMLGNVNFVVERVAVDTACSLGPPGTSAVGVTEIMRRAAVVVDPLGFRHLQIDWHDHLLLMTIDTFKDKLGAKPNAREDLIRMVSAPQFDIDRMLVLVRRARLETLVAVVADWILTTGHCSPWADLRDRLDPTRVRGRYRRLFPWLVRLTSRSNRSIPLGLLARAASDSPPRRILALALGVVGTTRFFVRHGSFTIGGGRPQAGAVRTCGRS